MIILIDNEIFAFAQLHRINSCSYHAMATATGSIMAQDDKPHPWREAAMAAAKCKATIKPALPR